MIVIVEDHRDTGNVLEREGLPAVHLCGGEELLDYLVAHVAELIVLDVMMPQMNGIECLRRIRGDPRRSASR